MAAQLQQWALPRLQQLLPLDDDSLKQIITYADTLPKDQAAEHLGNLLGTDPKALEFIGSFNSRRQRAPDQTSNAQQSRNAPTNNANSNKSPVPAEASGVPRADRRGPKKRKNIHALPARQVEGAGNVAGAYRKQDEQDYLPRHVKERQAHKEQVSDNLALQNKPADAAQMPLITDDATLTSKPVTPKLPPGASGQMVGDALEGRISKQTSRTASPARAKTKVNVTGGTAMHGASTALTDLDAAIRSLEVQTNPSQSAASAVDNKKRQCNCMATRHPLLDMAPNCLNCGKVICVKEGLGPCTFCEQPLLSSSDISSIVRVLKEERGEERMRANNATQKKADVGYGKSRAFTGRDFLAQTSGTASGRSTPFSSSAAATPAASDDEEASSAKSQAKAHRDKLLTFQANNARRTQIHDEAADYDIPTSGTNMWASPAERAQQLKRQQKVLREIEWNSRPEYEKRQVVASIDLKGGKVVRRMAEKEKPDFGAEATDEEVEDFLPPAPEGASGGGNGGAFSNNPLAKGLVRPTAKVDKGKGREAAGREKKNTWRRVQDDNDDNEQWILDGGVYGDRIEGRVLGEEEHAFG
ncbi:hypothetical protein MBLNU230_g7423t1 [Neophaeotheca triangularis]